MKNEEIKNNKNNYKKEKKKNKEISYDLDQTKPWSQQIPYWLQHH